MRVRAANKHMMNPAFYGKYAPLLFFLMKSEVDARKGKSCLGLAHAGSEYLSDGDVLEIPGPGAGYEVEFPETVSEFLGSGMEIDLVRHVSCSGVVASAAAHECVKGQNTLQALAAFSRLG